MKKPVKKTLYKIKKRIGAALLNFPILNYHIKKSFGRPDLIELVLALYLKELNKKKYNPFFVQIGANNGVHNDLFSKFVKKYNLRGVLIEPVPHLFGQLEKNYKNRKGLYFENVAIGNPKDQLTFYRVKSDKHIYYDQLGSFNKATILKHKKNIPNLEELIIEEPVQIMSFNTLVEKYEKEKIHLLVMDTEGYDAEIIKMIDFNKNNFDLVIFENKHLSPADHEFCIDLFQAHNFKAIVNEDDTLCIKNEFKDILKLTERLKPKT